MNAESQIEEEKRYLMPWRPPLELSQMAENRVDKYSFVRVDNNYYSVPEYLVGKKVTVRTYVKEIIVYYGLNEVCRHEKKDGRGEMSVNIFHYLETLYKKPGAIRNSKALKSEDELKAVFDCYYTTRAREFIEILRLNQDKPLPDIVSVLRETGVGNVNTFPDLIGSNVLRHTQGQLREISDFFMKGRTVYGD